MVKCHVEQSIISFFLNQHFSPLKTEKVPDAMLIFLYSTLNLLFLQKPLKLLKFKKHQHYKSSLKAD